MRRILVVVAGAVVTIAAAALIVREPSIGAVLLAVVVSALILATRPSWTVHLTLILAFIALPAIIPTEFNVSGITIRAHEPFLLLSVLYAVTKLKGTRRTDLIGLAFASFVALGFLVGFAHGNAPAKLLYDARPVAEGAAMIFVAVRVYGTHIGAAAVSVIRWVLWISAAVVFAGATLGLAVGGRTEEASLANPAADSGAATRLLTNTTFPALAVLCAVVALALARRATLRSTWTFAVPALLIVVLSFSRNSILAVGVAILFAVLATRTVSSVLRAGGILGTAIGVFTLLLVLSPVLAGLPGGEFVNTQVASYSNRVIDGLKSNVQATDASVLFRASEDAYLLRGWASAPILGHGFGFAYKPAAGTSSFTLDYAPYYAHNFYLWTLVKTGVLGGVMILLTVIGPFVRAVQRSSGITLAVGAALAGMMASSYVAPLPLSSTGSVLFGMLVGALAAATEPQKPVEQSAPEDASGDRLLERLR